MDRGEAVGDARLDLGKGAIAGKAGVVDQKIELLLPDDPLLDKQELLRIREVGDEDFDGCAGLGPKAGGQRLQTLPPAGDDQYVATICREALRERRSDTRRSAGDQGQLAAGLHCEPPVVCGCTGHDIASRTRT